MFVDDERAFFLCSMYDVGILGCGWLGVPLGKVLGEQGLAVSGSTTRMERFDELKKNGIEPWLADLRRQELATGVFDSHSLVIAVPPRLSSNGAAAYLAQMAEAHRRITNVRHVVFISSTSVYPELLRPVTEVDADNDHPLVQAENIFLSDTRFVTTVIRFAGLVGEGRHPGRFFAGKTATGRNAPVNLIHLEDCTGVIRAVLERKSHEGNVIINACAEEHPAKGIFYPFAARMAELPPPRFVEPDDVPYKIIDSTRLKEGLGYKFIFPDPMKMTFRQV